MKANEVLTEGLNEYEARLKERGKVLRKMPTMQIAHIKGIINKQKTKTREELEIVRLC